MSVFVGALSLGAVTSVINSISTLSINIYSLAANIKLNKNVYQQDITDVLCRTDLEATIKLLQSIIIEIPQYYNDSMSIVIALKNMQEIIAEVESELKCIHDKLVYNNTIYLMKNWRSYDFKPELRKLENNIAVMEKRRDNLFKTLEVFKNCEKNSTPNKNLLMIAELDNDYHEVDELGNSMIL